MKSKSNLDKLEIQLFGDVSLNGLLCAPQNISAMREALYKFDEYIGKPDLRMLNWEAPITTEFRFNELKQPAIATTLASSEVFCDTFKFDVACIGNNHIGDCLDEGYLSTRDFLKKRDIDLVGAGETEEEAQRMVTKKLGDTTIGILSYTGKETNPKIHSSSTIYLNEITEIDTICAYIKSCKKEVDLLLVNMHWGIEFIQYPNPKQKQMAKQIIDAGANIIVGHHSHCLQGVEAYNKGLIFYSLGNFLFSGLPGKESFGWPSFCNRGGGYSVSVEKDNSLSYKFLPFTVSNLGIDFEEKAEQNIKAQKRLSKKLVSNGLKYNIRYKFNAISNWAIRLPLFLIKTKGGLFKALLSYAKPKYIKLLLHYFMK